MPKGNYKETSKMSYVTFYKRSDSELKEKFPASLFDIKRINLGLLQYIP